MTRRTYALGLCVWMFLLGLIQSPFLPSTSQCAFADSFNMKTGAWEMTYTSVTSGIAVPPEMLEQMPPERRAKVEEAMRARSGQPKTRVHKRCITQNDLDQNKLVKGEGGDETQCATKVVSKSSTKLVMERTCPEPRAVTSQIKIEAKTPETVVGTIDGTVGSGKFHADVKGNWLGASCDDIKE